MYVAAAECRHRKDGAGGPLPNESFLLMKPYVTCHAREDDSQLGSTDQIEQRAADLARKENKTRVTDEERKEALQQMQETSPPPAEDKR